jgi:hypothetical protein
MRFAAIVPFANVEQEVFKSRQVQFCLAQHYVANQEYARAFRNMRDNGKFVILDNGVYEGALCSFEELAQCIEWLKPDITLFPDVLGNAQMTRYLGTQFHDYCGLRGTDTRSRGYVLQGHDIWALIAEYKWAAEQGYRCIAFSRDITKTDRGLRVELARRLQDIGLWENVRHHASGTCSGTAVDKLTELRALAKAGFDSCDSSSPVWRGNGQDGDLDMHSLAIKHPGWLKEADYACQGK